MQHVWQNATPNATGSATVALRRHHYEGVLLELSQQIMLQKEQRGMQQQPPTHQPVFCQQPIFAPSARLFNVAPAGLCSLMLLRSQREHMHLIRFLPNPTLHSFRSINARAIAPCKALRCLQLPCMTCSAPRRSAGSRHQQAKSAPGMPLDLNRQPWMRMPHTSASATPKLSASEAAASENSLHAVGNTNQISRSYLLDLCSAQQQERCQAKQQAADHAGLDQRAQLCLPSLTCTAAVHPC